MSLLVLLLAGCPSDPEVHRVYPVLSVQPESLDFGEVVEDYTSTVPLGLVNAGLAELEISAVTVEGEGFAIEDFPTVVEAGDTVMVNVSFTPPQITSYSGTLTIQSNDENSPHVVPLTGEGVYAPSPDIDVSPLNVDFGAVPAGTSASSWITIRNDGDGALSLGDVELAAGGSGAFTIVSALDDLVILPDQSVTAVLSYEPGHDLGDHATLVIPSDDPDEPTASVILIGNGGGDFEYPVALVAGPATAAPRDLLTIVGSGSYDPNGLTPLTYEWTLTGAPDGSAAADELTIASDVAYLLTDLAGEYEVQLRVTNTAGLTSAPATYTVDAIPTEQLHVELTWDIGEGDLDLHLQDGLTGEIFIKPGDCNFCNENPDWASTSGDDDPRLDIDDYNGYGPENINIDAPADGSYLVRVHYYETLVGESDAVATVNIFLNGVEAASYSQVMSRNEVWDVAEIVWPSANVVQIYDDLYASPRRSCASEP